MKHYTTSQILKEFTELDSGKTIEVLVGALDYMQQHNGKSKTMCIALAMGYKNIEGLWNTYFKENKK